MNYLNKVRKNRSIRGKLFLYLILFPSLNPFIKYKFWIIKEKIIFLYKTYNFISK